MGGGCDSGYTMRCDGSDEEPWWAKGSDVKTSDGER